jgi:threonine 3-dehydrogenase
LLDNDYDKAIIKIIYAGVCGSDKSLYKRASFSKSLFSSLEEEHKDYRIIGHELLGEIVDLGKDAKSKYKIGDIVCAESHIFCGTCYQCKLGKFHVCSNEKIFGITCDGCFAEYIKLPFKVLWPVNLNLVKKEVAAISEPFGNAVHACSKLDLQNKTVLLLGLGTIGLFCALVAKVMGASKIIGVEIKKENIELASKLGVDKIFSLPEEKNSDNYKCNKELASAIKDYTNGVGVDVAMELAGYNASVNNAIECTRRGGDIILFGLKSGDFIISNFERLIMDGKSLHSVIGRRVFDTWKKLKFIFEENKFDIQEKIYQIILNEGKNIIDFHTFNKEKFETEIFSKPKILLKF